MARTSSSEATGVRPIKTGSRRLASVALAATVVVMATTACAVSAQATGPSLPPRARIMQMVLRLNDLPPGYLLDDTPLFCGWLLPDGTPGLKTWIVKYHPRACAFSYRRLYRAPGQQQAAPALVADMIETPSVEAAQEGVAISPERFARFGGDAGVTEASTPLTIGDETRLFHTNDALVMDEGAVVRSHRPGSVLVWRYGRLLATVAVVGWRLEADDRVLARLAPLQQAHIEHPTPYTRSERDDTMVPLEDPRLRLPVYWLGRSFEPGHGRPASTLSDVRVMREKGSGPPGERLELQYTGRLRLGSWTRRSWKRYTATELAPLVRTWRCTRSQRLRLRRGYAIVYAGYRKDFAICPNRRPSVYLAVTHVGRLVVGVNLPLCEICIEGGGAYDSMKAMEAVVQRLRPRPSR